MSSQRSKLEGVDRPEPDEALSGTAARTPDHEPRDEDDREVVLDDPALPEIAIDEDHREPGPPVSHEPMTRGGALMPSEQAGIPTHSAVAQQVHHREHAAETTPRPEPAPIAAATVLKPDLDVTPLRAFANAIRCIVRSEDAGPRMSRSRIAGIVGGAAAVLSASIIVLRRRR